MPPHKRLSTLLAYHVFLSISVLDMGPAENQHEGRNGRTLFPPDQSSLAGTGLATPIGKHDCLDHETS